MLHRDSLGTEQVVVPGQLNYMTAGHGVAHSEEGTGRYEGELHGVQLWVAQPDATRHGPAAFEHHPSLPPFDLANGTATVLVGALAHTASPARRDTDHAGIDLALRAGTTTVPLRQDFEHGLVVFGGAVRVDGDHTVAPGQLAYLAAGRDQLDLDVRGRAAALLIGGVPLAEPPPMWWNYVARTRDEIITAHQQSSDRDDRFGSVASPLAPLDVAPPPWPSSGDHP